MCAMRGIDVEAGDDAPQLRDKLRRDVAARHEDEPNARVVAPTADRDSAARMALIDDEVRAHFAADPQPATSRDIARALHRNQQEVLLSLQRLGCPRQPDGRYRPDPITAARARLDAAVRAHFAAAPQPIATRALAGRVRGDQRDVELAARRLACPRLPGGLWGPPTNPNPGGQKP